MKEIRKYTLILFMVFLSSGKGFSQIYHDDDNYNQFASMEFKQWKFTPKSYYYSWYKKKVVLWHVDVPGLGIHDKGLAGTGVPKGDNYVNEDWRQMVKLRTSSNILNTQVKDKAKKVTGYWETMYKEDLLTQADRTIDAVSGINKGEINDLCTSIESNIASIGADKSKNMSAEYLRIIQQINTVKNSDMDNAKRLSFYNKQTDQLRELLKITEKAATLYHFASMLIPVKKPE